MEIIMKSSCVLHVLLFASVTASFGQSPGTTKPFGSLEQTLRASESNLIAAKRKDDVADVPACNRGGAARLFCSTRESAQTSRLRIADRRAVKFAFDNLRVRNRLVGVAGEDAGSVQIIYAQPRPAVVSLAIDREP